MLIYLDNCCFNRPFDDQSQPRIRIESDAKLEIQDKVRAREMELAWSYILDLENDANPYENRQTAIAAWKDLASKDTEETADIVAMANSLQSKDLKITDSLHLACAIALKCRCFFTTDDGILKKRAQISEIAVLNPFDYFTGNQP
jgi:predicted nucleic acid-binding protein